MRLADALGDPQISAAFKPAADILKMRAPDAAQHTRAEAPRLRAESMRVVRRWSGACP
jgi:hypothetical protein